jgi:hypothetical protein
MAVQSNRGYGFWWVRNEDGSPNCPTGELELDSNVGCYAGDALMRGADGYGDLWTSGNSIYGFAMETITADANAEQKVLVALATPQAIFTGYTDGAGAATIVGDALGINQTSGQMNIDQDVSTNAVFIYDLDESVSSTYGTNAQFLVKVIDSQLYKGRA